MSVFSFQDFFSSCFELLKIGMKLKYEVTDQVRVSIHLHFQITFSTQRIGLKHQTIVHINMYEGYTKVEKSKYFSVRVIAPFSVKKLCYTFK